MANRPNLEGDEDELVNLQFEVPLSMKRQIVEAAKARQKTMADWLRDLIRGALEKAPAKKRR